MKTWHVVLASVLAACVAVVLRAEIAVRGGLGPDVSTLLGIGILLIGLVTLTTLPEER